jgi:DNA mismatch repair ATPase MutS
MFSGPLELDRPMQIDATTISDLEIFQSPDGSEGLFQLIDRTSSPLGRKALRGRMARPSSDLRGLRRTQDAVSFLLRNPDLVWIPQGGLEEVDRYLRSTIEIARFPLGQRVEYAWMKLRYRDILKELQDGVDHTVKLFGHLAKLGQSIADRAPPGLIRGLVTEIQRAAQAVAAIHATSTNLLNADRAYRGDDRELIRQGLLAVAELDALNAMARSTAALGWTLPELVESDAFLLDAENVVHPFVTTPVPNPVRLSGGEPMIFLTGPNMGGKTTYLRSAALVVFLAQLGMGVPAKKARLTPVEALFTSLNPSDNLKAGLSYFLSEVMRVKAAATLLAEGRRAFVLFDEVFKGTNVKDALEASAEVILGFARARRSGCVFSSHLTDLVDILATNPRIRFCCFDADIVNGSPLYGYRLSEGASDKRFGLLLLQQARIPELLARIVA